MCGISSLFHNLKHHNRDIENVMFNALWTGSIRGHHSTGLIYEAEGKVDHFKKAVPGYDFMHLPITNQVLQNISKTPYLIIHNRAATQGEVKHTNAHPFQFDHITGVHNGTLSFYHDLTPKDVHHPVDSMHLYDAMSRKGWAAIAPEVRGSFNLLWHDDTDNTIHMCKNTDRPYVFAKIKKFDALIGMSEKAMLKWLVKRHRLEIEYCWTPKNNTEYIWSVAEDMVKPVHHVEHKAYVPPSTPVKKNNVANFPQQPGYKDVDFTRIETQEFFLDSRRVDNHLTAGQRTFTMYGENLEGDTVMILNCKEDEFEMETWYTGRGVYIKGHVEKSDYWRLYKDTVKPHPLDGSDEYFQVCVNCGDDHFDSQGVYIDNAPLCLECCRSLNVSGDRLDDPTEAWKLLTH